MPYGIVNTDTVRDSNGGILAPISSVFRNRIINGAMVIDQRNAGASVNLITGGGSGYAADRWYTENFTDGTATIQQVTDAPTGFSNSIKYTVTGTDSSLASDQAAFIQQRIEGFNSADLAFGTANAKTVTVSFWVKSSVTGTFSGALANNAYNRGYPFTFTINSANTWEFETVTIAGDTAGTWIGSTNGIGLRVTFAVAAGSARVSTAGAWAAYVGIGATGTTNLQATNGATFQVAGVQLEVGTSATGFEYRQYGQELALCQRYYTVAYGGGGARSNDNVGIVSMNFKVSMRTSPTVTYALNAGSNGTTATQLFTPNTDFACCFVNAVLNGAFTAYATASAEL